MFFRNISKILIELVLKTEKRVLGKKDCEEFLQKQILFSTASFSPFSVVSYNKYESLALPIQKAQNFHRSKEEEGEESENACHKNGQNQSPSPEKVNVHWKLQIYSSPWSVAYEGQRAMELKVRLAIDIIFDIARAFVPLCKFA